MNKKKFKKPKNHENKLKISTAGKKSSEKVSAYPECALIKDENLISKHLI